MNLVVVGADPRLGTTTGVDWDRRVHWSWRNPTFIPLIPRNTNKLGRSVITSWNIYFKNWKKKRKKTPIVQIKNNQHSFSISYDDSFHRCYASVVLSDYSEAVWKAGWTTDRRTDKQKRVRPTKVPSRHLKQQHTCKCGQRCSRLLVVVRSTLKIVIKYNPGPNGLENKTLCFNQARAALENKDRWKEERAQRETSGSSGPLTPADPSVHADMGWVSETRRVLNSRHRLSSESAASAGRREKTTLRGEESKWRPRFKVFRVHTQLRGLQEVMDVAVPLPSTSASISPPPQSGQWAFCSPFTIKCTSQKHFGWF